MADKKISAFGIYPSLAQAERGVDALVQGNFSNDDISVLAPDQKGTKDFAHEKHTKAPEGATTGVAAGGALGGTLGLLAGVGALASPGLGPFIAAGPIMGALAGLGVGGAVCLRSTDRASWRRAPLVRPGFFQSTEKVGITKARRRASMASH